MRILIDINHPAYVHFFREPIHLLRARNHIVLVTSRDKDLALPLLNSFGIEHALLSRMSDGGMLGLGMELIRRNFALSRIAHRFCPNVMTAVGGTFVAQAGALLQIPSVVFYDTENARLQNAITYPFVTHLHVPRAYQGRLPKGRYERYAGYHELSYLHPNRFCPNRERALAAGLAAQGDTFFVRLVSWQASHDFGEKGWTPALLEKLLNRLSEVGTVLISSECELPAMFTSYAYRGDVADVHHVMAYCRAFVGESATMASECAVLGVPAVYAARTGRGYTDEQEQRYGLVFNVRTLDWLQIESALNKVLALPSQVWSERRALLLADTIDVANYAASSIEAAGH